MPEETTESNLLEVSVGFMGNFPLKLDSAQRIAIPAKFKEVLDMRYGSAGSQVVLTPDFGKINVLPLAVWQSIQQQLESLSNFDPSADDYKTFVFGNMSICRLDAQNRVRLTPSLSRLGELQREVVMVGRQDRMEIWDSSKWDEFNSSTAKNFKSVMADVFRNRVMGVK